MISIDERKKILKNVFTLVQSRIKSQGDAHYLVEPEYSYVESNGDKARIEVALSFEDMIAKAKDFEYSDYEDGECKVNLALTVSGTLNDISDVVVNVDFDTGHVLMENTTIKRSAIDIEEITSLDDFNVTDASNLAKGRELPENLKKNHYSIKDNLDLDDLEIPHEELKIKGFEDY